MCFSTRNSNLCLFLEQVNSYLLLFAFQNCHFYPFEPLNEIFYILFNLNMRGVYIMCFSTRKIKSAYIWKRTILSLFCIFSVSCFYCCFAGLQVIVQCFDSILITLHIQYIAALPCIHIHFSPLNTPPLTNRETHTHTSNLTSNYLPILYFLIATFTISNLCIRY